MKEMARNMKVLGILTEEQIASTTGLSCDLVRAL